MWGCGEVPVFDIGDYGNPLNINGKFICISASGSNKSFRFQNSKSGISNYVDDKGRLLVSLPDDQIARFTEDDFTEQTDGNNVDFTLSYKPKSLSVFWNGLKVMENKDFSVSGVYIKTFFKAYTGNTLVAKYIY